MQNQKLQLNSLVWDKSSKRKGKLISFSRDMGKTAQVEFILEFDREKQRRVTELRNVETKYLSPYRKPKRRTKKYNPNEMYWMVQEFHKAFNHPYNEKPTPMDKETALNRAVWTGEELVELLYATVGGNTEEFKKLVDEFNSGISAAVEKQVTEAKPVDDILTAQADALTDVEYFNQGSFTILGVKPFNLFKIVQDANMAKLHNGQPKFRESDGKIIKPEGWTPPEPKLKAEIERQSKR